MRAPVKPLLAVTLLVVLAFAATGCGSAGKANSGQYQYTVTLHKSVPSGPITVTGTRTTAISNVKTGTFVRCNGGSGAKVPHRGVGVSESTGVSVVGSATTAPPPAEISIMHLPNGSITVTCKPSN